MSPLLAFLAILPAIIIITWVYFKDSYEKEPSHLLVFCFLWGCISTIPAIFGQMYFKHLENPDSLASTAIFSFFVIAFTEEISKFFFLRFYAYPKDEFNEPMDGIVYAVMIGMGFATLENILYVFSGENGLMTAIGRGLTAVPAHGAFAVLMGAYVGLAKFVPEKRNYYMFHGLALAVFFHGLYDFFLLQKSYEGLGVLSILTLTFGISLSRRLIKAKQALSPFKNQNIEPIQVQDIDNQGEKDDNLI
jgi:protease PrsW